MRIRLSNRRGAVAARAVAGLLILLGGGLFVASCSGDGPSGPDPATLVPATVQIDSPRETLEWIGETVQFSAIPLNSTGGQLLGEAITWSSDNLQVVTVSADGLVTAVGPGTTSVRARAGGAVGHVIVAVIQRPAQLVQIHGDAQKGEPRADLADSLVVELRDQGGAAVASHPLTWQITSGGGSITSAQAQTDAQGRGFARWKLGESPGTQLAEAVVGGMPPLGFSAEAEADPEPDGPLLIAQVYPSPLIEGEEAVIEGANLGGATVTIGGEAATVLSSSSESLRVRVPDYPCLPFREVEVSVQGGAHSASQTHLLRPVGLMEAVEIGDAWMSRAATSVPGLCFQLPSAGSEETYLVGLQSMAEAVSTITPALIQGAAGAVAASEGAGHVQAPAQERTSMLVSLDFGRSVGIPTPTDPTTVARAPSAVGGIMTPVQPGDRAGKARIMESGLTIAQGLMRDPGALPAFSASPQAPAPVPSVGSEMDVRIRGESCDEFTTFRTRVAHVGSRSIWVEDVDNPSGGFTAGDYSTFSNLYDQVIGSTLDHYMGPMTDLDGNGRVVVVVTKEVNRIENVNGFVDPVDLFPRQSCPSSNEGEYFFGVAPDPNGAVGAVRSVEDVRGVYPSLIAHEVTHIIHFGRQIHAVAGTEIPTVWESEGLATLAEELVGHAYHGRSSGQNLGWDAWQAGSGWYEYLVGDLAGYWGFQSPTSRVQGAPERCSWISRPEPVSNGPCLNGNRLPYGVPATLFRWIADSFSSPQAEAEITREIVDYPGSGYSLLEALTGWELDAALAGWSIALFTSDEWFTEGWGAFKSWDFRDIFGRVHETARLTPYETSGFPQVNHSVSVRAGSTAYFLVRSGARPHVSVGAQGLPDHMRAWMIRLR